MINVMCDICCLTPQLRNTVQFCALTRSLTHTLHDWGEDIPWACGPVPFINWWCFGRVDILHIVHEMFWALMFMHILWGRNFENASLCVVGNSFMLAQVCAQSVDIFPEYYIFRQSLIKAVRPASSIVFSISILPRSNDGRKNIRISVLY